LMIDCIYVFRGKIKYNYYDTAGQEKYRCILNLYFQGTDAAILVYSVDSMNSLTETGFTTIKWRKIFPTASFISLAVLDKGVS
jgi:GTPase SAR1 family protein